MTKLGATFIEAHQAERADGVNRFLGRRPLALLAGSYGVGALFGYYSDVPPLYWALGLLISVLPLAFWRRAVLIFALALFVGAGVTSLAAVRPNVSEAESALIEGRIAQPPVQGELSTMLQLDQVHIDGEPHPYVLRAYAYGDNPTPRMGDWVRIQGSTWLPRGQRNPGGFDFAAYLWMRGSALCASANAGQLSIQPSRGPSLVSAIGGLRERIGVAIDRLYPEHAPLARALLLGDRADLSSETEEDFRVSGLSHLLSISGLHVSCLALALEALLRALRMSRKRATLITLVLLVFYAALIGFPSSVVRAALMFLLVRGAALSGRPPDTLTGLSAAFLLILAVQPLMIADAGFQLSFTAVFAMLFLAEPVSRLLHMPRERIWPGLGEPKRALFWLWSWAGNLLALGIAIQLGTLPLLAYSFGAVSLLAPLTNLLAIPLSSLALPLLIIKLLIGSMAPAADFALLRLPDLSLELISRLASAAARLGHGSINLPAFPFWLCILYLVAVVCASPYVRIGLRVRKLLLCALPLMALCSLLYAWLLLPSGMQLTVLDAGQANALVLRAQGQTYLIDVGKASGPASSYLAYTGQWPQAVILTHPHADHAGGLGELLQRMRPQTIYLPECWDRVEAEGDISEQIERARAEGITIAYLKAGDRLALSDDVVCEVLQPESGFAPGSSNGNAASLVLEVRYQDGSALLCGDLPSSGELPMYPDVDVLLAAHHGSGSSNSERMLALTSPSALIVPVGRNGYGHPAARVLQSALEKGAGVYRTDQHGAVFAGIEPDGTVHMRTFLNPEDENS